jgi:hypothetical protein
MQLEEEGVLEYGRIRSEGKILEVMPMLQHTGGQSYMLPPAYWHVENWMLGFQDWHVIASPIAIWQNQQSLIPGTSSAGGAQLSFMLRILEDSELPKGAQPGQIDAAAVKALLEAVRQAPDVYQG